MVDNPHKLEKTADSPVPPPHAKDTAPPTEKLHSDVRSMKPGDSDGMSDAPYRALNRKQDAPQKLTEQEQKTADELVAAVKAARLIEQKQEKDDRSVGMFDNKESREALTKLVSTIPSDDLKKMLPTVNEELSKLGLDPPVRLAMLNNMNKQELYLGIKTSESKDTFSTNYNIGFTKPKD